MFLTLYILFLLVTRIESSSGIFQVEGLANNTVVRNHIKLGLNSVKYGPNETKHFEITSESKKYFIEFNMIHPVPLVFETPLGEYIVVSNQKQRIITESRYFSLWNIGSLNTTVVFELLRIYSVPSNQLYIFDSVENKTFEYVYKETSTSNSIRFEIQSLMTHTRVLWLCILYDEIINFEPECVLFEIAGDDLKIFTLPMEKERQKIYFFTYPYDRKQIITYSLKVLPYQTLAPIMETATLWILVGCVALFSICFCFCCLFFFFVLCNCLGFGLRCFLKKGFTRIPNYLRRDRNNSGHIQDDMTIEVTGSKEKETPKLIQYLPQHNESEYKRRRKVIPESEICCICMDYPRSVVFLPCGHFSCCEFCTKALMESSCKCPLCRAEISSHEPKRYGQARSPLEGEDVEPNEYVKNSKKDEEEVNFDIEMNRLEIPKKLTTQMPALSIRASQTGGFIGVLRSREVEKEEEEVGEIEEKRKRKQEEAEEADEEITEMETEAETEEESDETSGEESSSDSSSDDSSSESEGSSEESGETESGETEETESGDSSETSGESEESEGETETESDE